MQRVKAMGRRQVASFWLAGVLVLGAAPGVQAAGLFDELARAIFGAPRYRPVYEPVYEPLDVTVTPRPARPRAAASSKPAPPKVKLDPATDPHWYLRDPTLRRGDIVVTAHGVMVYQGRDSDTIRPADFAALGSNGKGAAKSWQQQLQAAAAGGRNFFSDSAPKPSPVALSSQESAEARADAR
jgi:hypothetical protein